MLQTSPFLIQLGNGSGTTKLTEQPLFIDGIEVTIALDNNGERCFTCNGRSITIAELTAGAKAGTGSACWLSSIAFFATVENYNLHGQDLLEIGSGVGLGGLSAAMYGNVKHVDMIDKDEILKPAIQYNITNNGCLDKATFTNATYEDIFTNNKQYECILALDCVYRSNCTNVANAIVDNLQENGRAIIINPQRDGLSDFLYTLMEYGTMAKMDDEISIEYSGATMSLCRYIFTKC